MPYARRSRRSYKRKLTRSKVLRSGSKAITQKRQIAKLAGSVNRINKTLKQARTASQYVVRKSVGATSPYVITELTPLTATRTRIFSDPSDTLDKPRFKFTKVNVDYLVDPSSEPHKMDMTMFIVSLKPDNANKVFVETSGVTSLIENTDFVTQHGKAMINFGRYNVHLVKRIQTFENQSTAGDFPATRGFTRGYFKKSLNWNLRSASGDWSSSIQDAEWPMDKRLYVILFNNNSSIDLEVPYMTLISVWSGYN